MELNGPRFGDQREKGLFVQRFVKTDVDASGTYTYKCLKELFHGQKVKA